MSDINSIATGAVTNYQRALATVANNIANVDSEGYSRQEVTLAENTPTKFGKSFFGTGARLDGVRRLYDEFIENSLRNSSSELNQQNPMVDYANRVINILGNENLSLSSALDTFFNSARELSLSPSSLVQRTVFMSDAEGLTARFKEISSQLDLVVSETEEAINSDITKVNILSEQLANINKQLATTRILSRQPMQLLDERDQVLRELSELVKVKVDEAPNGSVDVSLTNTFSSGVIVSDLDFERLFATFNENDISKVDLQLGQYTSKVEAVSSIGGGNLGGLLAFRKTLLEPTLREIDNLAKTFVFEVNDIHKKGLDLSGKAGDDLFTINPEFTVLSNDKVTNVNLYPKVIDPLQLKTNDIEFQFDAEAGQVSNLFVEGQFRKGDVLEITINGSTSKFTIPFLGIEDVGEEVSLEEVRDGLFEFLDANYGRTLSLSKETDRQINIRSEEFGFFSISPGALSSEGLISETTQRGLWTATDKATGLSVSGVESIEINGLLVEFEGNPEDGETLFLESRNRPSSGINLVFENPALIAAAGNFRIIDSEDNPSGINAAINVLQNPKESFYDEENLILKNVLQDQNFNELDSIVKEYDDSPTNPISIIPAGYADIQLNISQRGNLPVNLQLFSRDGNHIAGKSFGAREISFEENRLGRKLLEAEKELIRKRSGNEFIQAAQEAETNFIEGSSYINDYLNERGQSGYRDLDIFYGVRGSPQTLAELGLDHVVEGTEFVVGKIQSKSIPAGGLGEGFDDGTFTINGKELTRLEMPTDEELEASDVRQWLKPQVRELGIIVKASTEIIIDPKSLVPTAGLVINGTTVVEEESLLALDADERTRSAELNTRDKTALKLRDFINDKTEITGVGAYINPDGMLVINNRTGKNINIEGVSASNVLSITSTEYRGEIEMLRTVDQIRVLARDMNFDEGLTINNVSLGAPGAFSDVETVRDAINTASEIDYRIGHVFAFVDDSGALVISTENGEGIDIAGKNVLNVNANFYQRDFEQSLLGLDESPAEIRLGLGENGSPKDLERLGFDTSLYIRGSVPEDFLVFSEGDSSFALSSSFTAEEVDPIAILRRSPFTVNFLNDQTYQIVDDKTETILAERNFDVTNGGIYYQGLFIRLDGLPKSGDSFKVDGNVDGIGDNANIIQIAELEKKKVFGGAEGFSISEKYDVLITNIGTFAQRAGVTKEALTVVYDENVAKRDQVAGVSLDQEAADLVRYQQAYQASAKVMQTASVLFDAIIAIR